MLLVSKQLVGFQADSLESCNWCQYMHLAGGVELLKKAAAELEGFSLTRAKATE